MMKNNYLWFIIYSSYSVYPASVAAAACSSSLSPEWPCFPLVISFMPITTLAVGGNSMSSSVGFFNAISVIIVTLPPGIKSAWYRHCSPGVDSGAIFQVELLSCLEQNQSIFELE